ncbi:hypothetical protein, partial [Paenibacillus lactis]
HLKTSPNWGEVPFLCLKILVYQGLRLMQNAQFLGVITFFWITDINSWQTNNNIPPILKFQQLKLQEQS